MSIPFIQYLRPDGEKRMTTIDRPTNIEHMASAILSRGYRFESELLTDGQASFTITGKRPGMEEEDDLIHELCENGPLVPETVDRLIQRGFDQLVKS